MDASQASRSEIACRNDRRRVAGVNAEYKCRVSWSTRVTAFAVVHDAADQWLVLRHERLDVVRWELPGGHVDGDETAEHAAAREVLEETGVKVDVGDLVATCLHEWKERRQRRLILFFSARMQPGAGPPVVVLEPQIAEVAWRSPGELDRSTTSSFLYPLIDAWPDLVEPGRPSLFFRADHVLSRDGRWHPRLLDRC